MAFTRKLSARDNIIWDSSFQDLASQMEKLKTLWAEFIGKRVSVADYLKPHIADSWERSLSLGVDLNRPLPKVLPRHKLLQRINWSGEYIAAMEPIIDCLLNSADKVNFVVAYVDSEGYVLKINGNEDLLELLKSVNFVPGANWREEYAGTTAVGITLSTGQPSQVLHAEHFCQELKQFSCTAVPVHDPDSGQIAGVLDFIFRIQYHHPSLIGMATQIAKVAELTIEKNRREKETIFRDLSIQLTLDHIDKGVVIVEEDGRIRRINLKAMDLLKLESDGIVGSTVQEIPVLKDFWATKTSKAFINLSGMGLILERRPLEHSGRSIGNTILIEAVKETSCKRSWVSGPMHVVGDSSAFRSVLERARNAACYDSNVLIMGETGTGKEVIARFIHENSRRKGGPLVVINCGAIPKELLASELFGYEAGAFTGASQKGLRGKFELADKGTLVLDEISEMPLDAQVYLLRVIEERSITRLGSSSSKPVDVRLIAVSNKDLCAEVEKGRFRADLLFRLNVLRIHIPPLRTRKEDIITLAMHFLKIFSYECNKDVVNFSKGAFDLLLNYPWMGNVRELRNAIEHAVIMCDGKTIEADHLPIQKRSELEITNQIGNKEDPYLLTKQAYEQSGGNITKMAKILKVSRPTVYAWIKKYNIMKTF
ncbi:MAG: sigma-54-dependent Fis family transcriptional regulator [Desulfatiglandales bacterium]